MKIKVEQFKSSVKSNSNHYSDQMLFNDYQNLRVSYNAEAAGLSRFGVVGYVAVFRMHLVELLLVEPIKLLFICGIDNADSILNFIKSNLSEEGSILWNDAGEEGREWLSQHLDDKKLFIEVLISNFKEFTGQLE